MVKPYQNDLKIWSAGTCHRFLSHRLVDGICSHLSRRNIYLIFFLLFGFWMSCLKAETIVEASIDSTQTQADYPIIGLLTITHSQKDKVDPQSVRLEGQPLQVSLLKETPMTVSPPTTVSIYQFQLPAQKKGSYSLPTITVKVGDQTYQSAPTFYSVRGAEEALSPSSSPSVPPLFRLEAKVEGPLILYPGQRLKLIYRILFNQNIDLTRSILPFPSSPAFQKIGDVHIQDTQQGDVTIQELRQEVEASQVGRFSFGPASIEGYAYTLQGGQKIYVPMLLHAKAPALTLEVKPFPRLKQPPSFIGALGRIDIQAHLLSPSSLQVGDRLILQIQLKGVQPLADLTLPDLACQPGFSGFFQMSDLPPQAEVKEEEKIFQVELRALSSLIDRIPPIEVSSFDQEKEDYHIAHTSPIPVTIHLPPSSPSQFLPTKKLFSLPTFDEWPIPPLPSLRLPIDLVAPSSSLLIEANHFYEKGGRATTFEEREVFFNQALFLYHLAAKETPSAELYRVLGDLYFQLGEKAWAVLFYERALKKDPSSSLAFAHLKKAQEELDLPLSLPSSPHSFPFSLPFIMVFMLVLFIIYLISNRLSFIFFQKLAKIGTILFAFFFCYLLLNSFSTPVEGILTEPGGLYRSTDPHQVQLISQPLMPGSKVEILQVIKDGSWLKIRTQEGQMGYIPAEPIRLI